jgi:nicotinate-nucleotide adenylyltransferase
MSRTSMRIALFGGSFDPVHLGHLLVAQAAREEVGLDRLSFIPAAQSPFKPDRVPAPAELRLRLLRLALASCPWCFVDDQELRRGGASFTIITVRDYAARFPDARLYWLVGEDHVATLPQWREAEELARLVEFLVIPRPPRGPGAAAGMPAAPAEFRLRWLKGVPFAVSASEIRQRVRAGLPLDWLVPAAVAEAIRNNRLYL